MRAICSRVSLSIEAKPRFDVVSSSLSVMMVSGAGVLPHSGGLPGPETYALPVSAHMKLL